MKIKKSGKTQRWLMIPVEDQDPVYEDVLRLVELRRTGGKGKD